MIEAAIIFLRENLLYAAALAVLLLAGSAANATFRTLVLKAFLVAAALAAAYIIYLAATGRHSSPAPHQNNSENGPDAPANPGKSYYQDPEKRARQNNTSLN